MQDSGIINFEQVRDFGGKMNVTYLFIKQNFRGLTKSLLFFASPFILLSVVLSQEMVVRVSALQSGGMYNPSPFGLDEYYASPSFWLHISGALVFGSIGGALTLSTIYAYLLLYFERKTIHLEITDVWKKTKELFWTNLGSLLLYLVGMGLAIVILMLPTVLVTFIASFITPFLAVFGILLYYISFIALSVYFSMVFIIQCRERKNFFDALSRLFKLTRQWFWNTVVFGSVNFYIQVVFSILFIIPWYIYLYIVILHDTSSTPLSNPSFIEEAINTVLLMIYSLAGILLWTLPLIAMAVQYFSLVEFKEARGLIADIENFGQIKPATDVDEDF